MPRIMSLFWVIIWVFSLLWGVGCSKEKGDDSTAGDELGQDDPDAGRDDGGDMGFVPDGGNGDGGNGDAGHSSEQDSGHLPDQVLPGLDFDNCQLDYAPEAISTYDINGNILGIYTFEYDDAGHLVRFVEEITVRVEYDFEYEGARLIKTTKMTYGDETGAYEATFEYNDEELPTAIWGRTRDTEDDPWRHTLIEMDYEKRKLIYRVNWICEAEGTCNEQVVEKRYLWNARGLLVETESLRDDGEARYALEYDSTGNLLSNMLVMSDGQATYRGNIYKYEDNRLVWRDVHVEDAVISSRGYVWEDDRLSLSKDPETGRLTYFDWTEAATACTFLAAWHLLYINSEMGDTSQEMLTRIYGYGGPTGLFF